MNYEQMSDLVIDRKVFVSKFGDGDADMEKIWKAGKFRPTQDPKAAWPIIVENSISLYSLDDYDDDIGEYHINGQWQAMAVLSDDGFHYKDSKHVDAKCESPLRAAMICFLLLKDAEK